MAQKKRDVKEIEATRDELPTKPPEEIVEEIKKRQKVVKLVYRLGYYREPITGLKHKAALVTCTGCGERYYLDYASGGCGCHCGGYGDSFGFVDPLDSEPKQTGSTCVCPECGAGAEGLHIGHIRHTTEIIDKSYFMTIHNVRGHFAALSWILFKECDKDGKVYYTLQKYEATVIIGGMPIRYTGYTKCMYGVTWSGTWITRPVWKETGDEWDAFEIFAVDDIEGTDAAKSAVDVFIREGQERLRIGAYMQLWTKYPQIENLTRNRLTPFVKKLIEEATTQTSYTSRVFSISLIKEHINVKKVKPTEILGLKKEDLPLANAYKIQTLEFYREILDTKKIKLTPEQLKTAESFGISALQDLFEDGTVPVIRGLNYLERQRKISGNLITVRYLLDYWDMQKEIQHGLPEELKYPKNLQREHDLAVLRKKEKTNREINEKIVAFAQTLDWLAYEDEETGLLIRAAQDQEEMIKEGKFLSHCVATYAKSVSERKTCILFIRKIEAPEIPFFTLEYKDGKVVQNRGKSNCDRTPEVVAFEAKWIQHIKELKESLKNGKRIKCQTAASARA